MAKRLSIINFKGGVGKTTLAFNFAAALARFHEKRVLLVDMDHQSSLSIICLGAKKWQAAVAAKQTINEIFLNFVGKAEMPGDEIICEAPLRSSKYELMDVAPASLALDDTEIELTASHQGNAIGSEWNKRTLLCRWLEEAEIDERYDYIVFDCPPATKIISQNAIAASHGYVIPVVPEAVMERGAPHLNRMIKAGIDNRLKALDAVANAPRSMYVSETSLIGLVVTRIAVAGNASSGYTDDHTRHLNSLERQWKGDLLKPYIVQGTGVSESLTAGVPVYDRADTQNIGRRKIHTMYKELSAELKDRVDNL